MNQTDSINVNDLDRDMRHELAAMFQGESLLNCIQCGVCSSGCTVSEWMDLQPHIVVSSLLMGMKDRILGSRAIWTCSLCHRCTERCPKAVDYSFLLALLRSMAMKGGNVPEEYIVDLQNVYDAGFSLPMGGMMSKSVNRRRERAGLPSLGEVDVDAIRAIITKTGLDTLLDTGKQKEEA